MAAYNMEVDGNGAAEHLQGSELALAELVLGDARVVPIVEVAFRNDMWWSMPQALSAALVATMNRGEDAVYTWDWGPDGRKGSWAPDGATTSVNRYMLDFRRMVQRNMDNNRERSIRIVYVQESQVTAGRSGEIPEQ